MTREQIYLAARAYDGVPWRHRGRTATGLDCGGLVIMLCRQFEVPHEDIEGYSRYPDGTLIDTLARYLTLVQGEPRPGMVAVIRDQATPCHVGIVGARKSGLTSTIPTLIHSTLSKRQVREEPLLPFAPRLRCLFDFPGVED